MSARDVIRALPAHELVVLFDDVEYYDEAGTLGPNAPLRRFVKSLDLNDNAMNLTMISREISHELARRCRHTFRMETIPNVR